MRTMRKITDSTDICKYGGKLEKHTICDDFDINLIEINILLSLKIKIFLSRSTNIVTIHDYLLG